MSLTAVEATALLLGLNSSIKSNTPLIWDSNTERVFLISFLL